jgi:hypothetical protein
MFGLTPKIGGFILTRDSALLIWGKVVGVAGLIVSGAIQPSSLGLSDKQAKLVMGTSAAVLAISAKLANSPLPSKSDAEKVSLPVKEQP